MRPNFTYTSFVAKKIYYTIKDRFTLLLMCCVVFCALSASAQDFSRSSSLTFQLGGNNFLGDLGGTKGNGAPFIKDFNFRATRLFTGFSYAYYPLEWLSVNGDLHLTGVAGADSLIKEKDRVNHSLGRFQRNLSFKSFIYELQATANIYPLQIINPQTTSRFRPYAGTGIGVFHFNPKAELNGQWYFLQPLHLEGQGFTEYPNRKNYKLTQVYIPFNIGLQYRINDSYLIGLNAIFRKTFTDYIDDVSTTYIDPSLFDVYLSPYQASIAKQLYYRGNKYYATPPNPYRGYPGNDSYTSVFLSLTYFFNSGDGSYGGHRFNKP